MKNTEFLYIEQYNKYKQFIEECKNKKYEDNLVLHRHHIIAKHLGGTDESSNIVNLSVEDHVQAHLLLAECFDKNSYEYHSNLKSARILNKKSIKDRVVLDKILDSYRGEGNPFYGKTHTQEVKDAIGKANTKRWKGKKYEDVYGERAAAEKEKRSISVKNDWNKMSKEEKKRRSERMSIGLKGKNAGADNGFAQPVIVDGIKFETVKKAMASFGYSYQLKLYKNHIVIKLNKNE